MSTVFRLAAERGQQLMASQGPIKKANISNSFGSVIDRIRLSLTSGNDFQGENARVISVPYGEPKTISKQIAHQRSLVSVRTSNLEVPDIHPEVAKRRARRYWQVHQPTNQNHLGTM
jgi:hypothetical protein